MWCAERASAGPLPLRAESAGGAAAAQPGLAERRLAATSARMPLPAISISAVYAAIAPIVQITASPKVVNSTEATVPL